MASSILFSISLRHCLWFPRYFRYAYDYVVVIVVRFRWNKIVRCAAPRSRGFRCSMSHFAGNITQSIHEEQSKIFPDSRKSHQGRRRRCSRGFVMRQRDPRVGGGWISFPWRGLLNAILDFCWHYDPPADTRPRNDEGNLKLVMPRLPYTRSLFIPNGPTAEGPFRSVHFHWFKWRFCRKQFFLDLFTLLIFLCKKNCAVFKSQISFHRINIPVFFRKLIQSLSNKSY